MVNYISLGKAQSCYVKVSNFPGLYRHTISGRYYGAKKLRGKRKECSLRTSDRKIAERQLREWMRTLQLVHHELEKTKLCELVDKFVAVYQGKSAKTSATIASIIRQMECSFPCAMDIEVRQIRSSHLEEWLALKEKRLKNTSYNRYAGFLHALFYIAVRDGIIAESPFARLRTQIEEASGSAAPRADGRSISRHRGDKQRTYWYSFAVVSLYPIFPSREPTYPAYSRNLMTPG